MSKPINSLASPRFCGVRTFMRLPYTTDLKGMDFAMLGVPFDTGTSYKPGCRFGSAAIREASAILKSYHSELDVNIFEECSGIDFGDVDIVPGYTEESYDAIEKKVAEVLASDVIPVMMGGDHSITLPELRAVAKKHGPVALVHFDAHSDTGKDYFGKPYNHGTVFYHAIEEGLIIPQESTQIGIRGPLYDRTSLDYAKGKGLEVVSGWKLHEIGLQKTIEIAKKRITANRPVFLTFDIDFLDASYAPGTGTPEIAGFTTYEALFLLLGICKGQNLIGMDLVEVLPECDHGDITSFAAAGIIHAFLACLADNKKNSK